MAELEEGFDEGGGTTRGGEMEGGVA